jgi:hypothetical protein
LEPLGFGLGLEPLGFGLGLEPLGPLLLKLCPCE